MLTFKEFVEKFKNDDQFYVEVRDEVVAIGGANLWDGQDFERFYEIYIAYRKW